MKTVDYVFPKISNIDPEGHLSVEAIYDEQLIVFCSKHPDDAALPFSQFILQHRSQAPNQ